MSEKCNNITALTKGEKGDPGATGSGGAGILSVKVSISSASIKTGFSAPIDVIAAPGDGFAIDIISAAVRYTFATTAYNTGKNISLKASSGTYAQFISSDILNKTSARFSKLYDASSILANVTPTVDMLNQLAFNSKIVAVVDADSTIGDATATLYVSYRIITL